MGVKSKFVSEYLPHWSCDGLVEDLWVSVALEGGKSLLICCVYVPPHPGINHMLSHFNKVEDILSKHINSKIIIVGDHNLPSIQWEFGVAGGNNYCKPSGVPGTMGDILVNYSCILGLSQHNYIKNSRGNVLDLLLARDLENTTIKASEGSFLPEDPFHKAFEFYFNVKNLKLLHAQG